MADLQIISDFPSFIDHLLIWIFGWILPFMSGVKSRGQLDGIVFTETVRRRFYIGNSLFLFLAAAVVAITWYYQDRPFYLMGFRNPSAGSLTYAVPLGSILLILWLADFVLTYRRQKTNGSSSEERKEFPTFLPQHLRELPAYLLLSFSAAVFEETIYRGFMVTYFLPASRGQSGWPVAALIVPALLFSLAHYYQGWRAVMKIWGFAVGLGLLFIITGSLWPVMIIHFIIDFAGGWLAMILGRKQA